MAYFVDVKGKRTPLEDFVIANTGKARVFPPSSTTPGAVQSPFNVSQSSAVVQTMPVTPPKSVTFFIDRHLEAEQRYEIYEDAKMFGTIQVRSCLPTENRFRVHATMR